jgi:hypothetical protein
MPNSVAIIGDHERIVQLVGSGVWRSDDGVVQVTIHPEEPGAGTRETELLLTEDDAYALADALSEAAQLVARTEPQAFIRVAIVVS